MKKFYKFMLIFLILLNLKDSYQEPTHVHISYHRDTDKIVINWNEYESKYNNSMVYYGLSKTELNYQQTGEIITNFRQDLCITHRYIHEVILTNLKSNTQYFYMVSSDSETYSNIFSFRTLPNYVTKENTKPLRVSVFGDLTSSSFVNITSTDQLLNNTINDYHDFIIHSGDIAYNLNTNCGKQGDQFLDDVQNITANTIYLFGVGDHEREDLTYKNFKHRFIGERFLGEGDIKEWMHHDFFWSFKVDGIATFIYINTGAYIDVASMPTIDKQYHYLKTTLSEVDRSVTPYIIVVGHRSLYCTKTTDNECNSEAETLRNGWDNKFFGLEKLFYEYGVDVYLGGHTHHSQNTYPVYQSIATQENYTNPKATCYFVGGIGGPPSVDYIDVPNPSFMQYTDFDYNVGYNLLTFHNATHLSVDFHSAVDNSILHHVMIQQDNHGSFEI
eukprot:TRINITY_DN16505_c0_g1_i1.p1 TRINITY_DN16505_c0_g1~~TRINITY_DN16505_c0_g1_i1.p1  ORF type:complete len:444 (-),score=79.77 TRINITY_DN16505_c0_g1_i1:106-1437(-)